jgi:PIN domain nuclease of toxin-antitoxin system
MEEGGNKGRIKRHGLNVKAIRPLLFDLQAIVAWAHGEVPSKVIHRVREGHVVHVSSVSPWEFLLKKNRQSFGIDYHQLLQTIKLLRAQLLPLKEEHLDRLQTLTVVKDQKGKAHNDPFDRLLIAQALQEDFVLVGTDHMFSIYQEELPLKLLWEV